MISWLSAKDQLKFPHFSGRGFGSGDRRKTVGPCIGTRPAAAIPTLLLGVLVNSGKSAPLEIPFYIACCYSIVKKVFFRSLNEFALQSGL